MAQKLKVHELLNASELEELEAFAREPGRTIDECWEHLQAHGFTLSRNAVWNWKFQFDQQVMKERFGRSGELAAAIKGAVSDGKFETIADAAVMQLTQIVFEQAAQLEAEGAVDKDDLAKMSRALANLGMTKQRLENLKDQYESKQKLAVEAASKVAQSGGNGAAVVNKVREILGMGVAA